MDLIKDQIDSVWEQLYSAKQVHFHFFFTFFSFCSQVLLLLFLILISLFFIFLGGGTGLLTSKSVPGPVQTLGEQQLYDAEFLHAIFESFHGA